MRKIGLESYGDNAGDVAFDLSEVDRDMAVFAPQQAFVYCLSELLKNAYQASVRSGSRVVTVRLERRMAGLAVEGLEGNESPDVVEQKLAQGTYVLMNADEAGAGASSVKTKTKLDNTVIRTYSNDDDATAGVASALHEAHDANARDYFLISVTDEGSGISEEELPHVFNWLFSSKRSAALANAYETDLQSQRLSSGIANYAGENREDPTKKAMMLGGWGMGLPMARVYARNLGGDVWLESEEGVGTTAYLKLPNYEAYHKDAKTEMNEALSDRKLMSGSRSSDVVGNALQDVVLKDHLNYRDYERYIAFDTHIKLNALNIQHIEDASGPPGESKAINSDVQYRGGGGGGRGPPSSGSGSDAGESGGTGAGAGAGSDTSR